MNNTNIWNNEENNGSTSSQRQTKDEDKQLEALLILYELAARLLDAAQALEIFHSIFKDERSSNRSKESALHGIKKNVIPLLKHASSDTPTIHNLASVVAPIASALYVHRRLKTQKKQAAAAAVTPTDCRIRRRHTSDRKSRPLRWIENTLRRKKTKKTRRGKKATPTEQPTRRSSRRKSPMHPSLANAIGAPVAVELHLEMDSVIYQRRIGWYAISFTYRLSKNDWIESQKFPAG